MSQGFQYPFKIISLDDNVQKQIAEVFGGYPNGLVSTNHWGFKLSATVTDQELQEVYQHPLRTGDVWVVTPPKCGTTWTQEMVWLLANDLDYERAKTPLIPNRWQFIDFKLFNDKEAFAKLTGQEVVSVGDDTTAGCSPPPFVKSHLPLSMNNPRLLDHCKVVYVARNPKDACVSYYHHCRLIRIYDFTGDIELFAELFMSGNLPEAPVIEHMIEAWNLRHHPNMCFIFFEDMKKDIQAQIRKVSAFLGKSYSDEQVDKLASHLHFDNIKRNRFVNFDHTDLSRFMMPDRGSFIRKGQTGDWKNHFTPEVTARFDKWMAEKLKGTDLKFEEE